MKVIERLTAAEMRLRSPRGHRRSMKTLSPTRILRVLRHVQPLCLAADESLIPTSHHSLGKRFALLPTRRRLGCLPRFADTSSGNLTPSLTPSFAESASAATTAAYFNGSIERRQAPPTLRFVKTRLL